MTPRDPIPRLSLSSLSSFLAIVFGWASVVLPWRAWTVFAVATAVVAVAHAATAVLAWLGPRIAARAWRIQAAVALAYLGYLTWNLVASTSYIVALYGSLGRGVAVALGLVWLIVVALTVPLSVWGIVATGGLRASGWRRGAPLALLVLFAVGAFGSRRAAAAEAVLADVTDDAIARDLVAAFGGARRPRPDDAPSLMTAEPVTCARAPDPGVVTVIRTALEHDEFGRPVARSRCVQRETWPELVAALAPDTPLYAGPIAIDVVAGVRPLRHLAPVVDGLLLRPGLDGVCAEAKCLVPWQLLALDVFRSQTPIPVIPDLTFGVDFAVLRRAMGEPYFERGVLLGAPGLTRIETKSYVVDAGEVVPLRRMREAGPALTPEGVRAAKRAAEDYIVRAQGDDGRFEYKLNPFTGQVSYRGFSLPRQAGTTLVLCELAEDRERAREVVTAALSMLATTERRMGERSALAYPVERDVETFRLGDTALAAIAFLRCRDLVGDQFDPLIGRVSRLLLAMQKPNGSFFPSYDAARGAPDPGPDPLYAVGQAVFALALLERVAGESPEFPEDSAVRVAVERAMDYVAQDYWLGTFTADFFFFEENWHCLAAAAALGHHRHAGYENFCLDYVKFKSRLILDEDSRVDHDLVGGYGFGNVLLPHNTGSAGFGEAASAALAIAEARGEPEPDVARSLELALAFLLHHQWSERTCFACSAEHPVAGAFSEHMGSMTIRIDYVQHAMAALGHGAVALGWAERAG